LDWDGTSLAHTWGGVNYFAPNTLHAKIIFCSACRTRGGRGEDEGEEGGERGLPSVGKAWL